MRVGHLTAMAALMIGITPGASHATSTILTYRGTVLSGIDAIGMFGDRGVDLTNFTFEAIYSVEYDIPDTFEISPFQYYVSSAGLPAIANASLTINDNTWYIDGSSFALAYLAEGSVSPFSEDEIYASVQSDGPYVSRMTTNVHSQSNDFIEAPDFSIPFTYNPPVDADAVGEFFAYGFDPLDGLPFFTGLSLSVTYVQSSGASAVPEPAIWTMMVGGFGLVGAALRRRTVAVRLI